MRTRVSTGDGRSLEVVVAGPDDGVPLVVHHGTPGAAGEYPPYVADCAERGLRRVTYSRPGYAGSERAPGRSVADCATDVAAIADALGFARFYTVGGSGGGPHALACAAVLGDRVLAAAAVASVAPRAEDLDWLDGMGEDNRRQLAAAIAGPRELRELVEVRASGLVAASADELADELGNVVSDADRAAISGPYADYMVEQMQRSLSAGIDGWVDDGLAFAAAWGFDPVDIGVPVAVWYGLHDRFVPPAHGGWLAERIGGATTRVVHEEGHLLYRDHHGEILDDLIALAGRSARAGA